MAGLATRETCIALASTSTSDEDYSLIVGDFSKRLLVFSGKTLACHIALLGTPTAVCAFSRERREAAIAVAADDAIFVYRNLRPYFKFSLAPLPLSSAETSVWDRVRAGALDADEAYGALQALVRANPTDAAGASAGSPLSHASLSLAGQQLLATSDPLARVAQVRALREAAQPASELLRRADAITCMCVLQRDFEDRREVGLLVFGTESRALRILSADLTRVTDTCMLPDTPSFLAAHGQYSVGYRVAVACRSNVVYFVRGSELHGSPIEAPDVVCGLVLQDDKTLLIACANSALYCYHTKGKRRYALRFDSPITSCAPVDHGDKAMLGVAVGLASGQVRLYNGRTLVSCFETGRTVCALAFGQYQREARSLIVVLADGTLMVKMLPRSQADRLGASVASLAGPSSAEQDTPLALPRRTKLYVDQTTRERQEAAAMHRVFQRGLARLRLAVLRSYVDGLRVGAHATVQSLAPAQAPAHASGDVGATSVLRAFRLSCQVLGLGPTLRVVLTASATGDTPVVGVQAGLVFDDTLYAIAPAALSVPLLVPGAPVSWAVLVRALRPGIAGLVHIRVSAPQSDVPSLNYAVRLPASEVPVDL